MRCRSAVSAMLVVVGSIVTGVSGAHAQEPEPVAAVLDRIVSIGGSRAEVTAIDGRQVTVRIRSAAMGREVSVKVQRPADTTVARPSLYLVNGAGGGEDTATWEQNTDVVDFLAGKDVNVVMPIGGAWSYYTDWREPDPMLGVNKWRTFFLDELPALVDTMFATTGKNAIAANSMTATSVLQLAIAKPGLFRSVAAYSGCAQISDPVGKQFVDVVVATGGGDASNMYGPPGDPAWVANDPVVNAEGLRGTKLYVSNGNGLPGEFDKPGDSHLVTWGPVGLANQIVIGGVIEATTRWCTVNLQNRLEELDIPATFDLSTQGTHSWGYWQKAFKNSWPLLAEGMEIHA
ncbi:alpha/beta hydrolase [Nocardia alba]|uniref:S-formylglutathione hydrolase FrmB n=1 Tax=Nocardia alba TaxID=225051 RepID=A0A4R1FTH5_9NOCA|nr:alpha/beta hydrolase family protein [Nocardia alba]TCJ97042.1 S-formylglutathione hydrolase FrmB [Nocardia alba]